VRATFGDAAHHAVRCGAINQTKFQRGRATTPKIKKYLPTDEKRPTDKNNYSKIVAGKTISELFCQKSFCLSMKSVGGFLSLVIKSGDF